MGDNAICRRFVNPTLISLFFPLIVSYFPLAFTSYFPIIRTSPRSTHPEYQIGVEVIFQLPRLDGLAIVPHDRPGHRVETLR
jgi:hypothetical protein